MIKKSIVARIEFKITQEYKEVIESSIGQCYALLFIINQVDLYLQGDSFIVKRKSFLCLVRLLQVFRYISDDEVRTAIQIELEGK